MKFKDFKAFIESEEGKKAFEKLQEDLKHNDEIETKYCNKFHSMTKENRQTIVSKIIDKYSSNEYINREMNKCKVMPRTPLYYLLFEYAFRYGKIFEDNKTIDFPSEAYIFDDNIIVECIYGQGTIINVFFNGNKN